MQTRSLSLAALLAATSIVVGCADQRSPSEPSSRQTSVSASAHGGAAVGFTDGWENGTTVSFFYTKNFFCAEPPSSGAPTQCEVGEDGTVDPRPGPIPELYVLTPMGITVPQSTLHCPIAGSCINHPSTIDLSRLLGPSAANAPLPPHSHVIDERHGGWWELEVIGVTSLDAWNQIVAAKSLDKVRELQAAHAGVTDDIKTNVYLFFSVRT